MTAPLEPRRMSAAAGRGFVADLGLRIGARSPLQALGAGVAEAPSRAITDDGELRRLFARLASPECQVRVVVVGPAGVNTLLFYGSSDAPDELVSFRAVPGPDGGEGAIEVGGGWTPRRVAMITGMSLDPIFPLDPGAPRFTLTSAGLLALASTLDAFRDARLRSLLARAAAEQPGTSPDRILDMAEVGLESDDRRWLVTLLAWTAPLGLAPDVDTLTAGFSELAQAALVGIEADGGVVPSPQLRRLLEDWTLPLPAVATEVTALADDGALIRFEHVLFLRGATQAWTVRRRDLLGVPRVEIEPAEAAGALDALVEMVTPAGRGAAAAVGQGSAAVTPPQPSEAPFCRQCGAPLRAGAPFCSSCGQPTSRRDSSS